MASGDEPNEVGGPDRASNLHRKGLISDAALAKAKAKAKKKAMPKAEPTKDGLPKIERQEDSSNKRGENDPADDDAIEGGGGQPGVKSAARVDDGGMAPGKKGLALDDDD